MKHDKPSEVYDEMIRDIETRETEIPVDDLPTQQRDWLRAR